MCTVPAKTTIQLQCFPAALKLPQRCAFRHVSVRNIICTRISENLSVQRTEIWYIRCTPPIQPLHLFGTGFPLIHVVLHSFITTRLKRIVHFTIIHFSQLFLFYNLLTNYLTSCQHWAPRVTVRLGSHCTVQKHIKGKYGDMGFFSYRVPEPWATPLYRQETSFNSGRKGEKLFVGEAHFQILQNQFSPLIKIPSACPASVPLTVRGVVSDKGAGSSFSRQMLTLSIKCSGNLWGCKDFRQQIPNVEGGNVPCALDRHSGVRQKARVLSLILSQTRCQSLRLQRT